MTANFRAYSLTKKLLFTYLLLTGKLYNCKSFLFKKVIRAHQGEMPPLTHTNTSLPPKVFVYTSRYYLLFLFSASAAQNKMKITVELLSSCVNSRSRVRFLWQNICHISLLKFQYCWWQKDQATDLWVSASVPESNNLPSQRSQDVKLSEKNRRTCAGGTEMHLDIYDC